MVLMDTIGSPEKQVVPGSIPRQQIFITLYS
jgi:hypothetical protein